ncbi:MAG: sigma-54-dependent Fis family transcriptional regulator [Planctomycetes bacterium]|nr:sigma-54-dependent Fis family transcriptional regulator [Planctomycetota bacterium]
MRILVVDDEEHIRDACKKALERVGYSVRTMDSGKAALDELSRNGCDLLLLDIKMPEMGGLELLAKAKEIDSEVVGVMMTGYASIETAIESIRKGAYEYVPKPFTPDQIRAIVQKALEHKTLFDENRILKEELKSLQGGRIIFGKSPEMQRVHDLVSKIADTGSSVLVTGESGTGKELIARMIHERSGRSSLPFVTVNCAAIPESLLESELFGHRKGAFTGAEYHRRGSFEVAGGGTVFLDEIAEMHPSMQAKILRVLEYGEVKRVGAEEPINVDVRIIAATNRDLEREVKAAKFREDLYFRLNVVRVDLPPLRSHKADIPILAQHFLSIYSAAMKKGVRQFSDDAMEFLVRYEWPGNIRELENAVERAVILSNGPTVKRGELAQWLAVSGRTQPGGPGAPAKLRTLEELEMEYIQQVLESCGGNRKRAAEILGISTVSLWRRLGSSRKPRR